MRRSAPHELRSTATGLHGASVRTHTRLARTPAAPNTVGRSTVTVLAPRRTAGSREPARARQLTLRDPLILAAARALASQSDWAPRRRRRGTARNSTRSGRRGRGDAAAAATSPSCRCLPHPPAAREKCQESVSRARDRHTVALQSDRPILGGTLTREVEGWARARARGGRGRPARECGSRAGYWARVADAWPASLSVRRRPAAPARHRCTRSCGPLP